MNRSKKLRSRRVAACVVVVLLLLGASSALAGKGRGRAAWRARVIHGTAAVLLAGCAIQPPRRGADGTMEARFAVPVWEAGAINKVIAGLPGGDVEAMHVQMGSATRIEEPVPGARGRTGCTARHVTNAHVVLTDSGKPVERVWVRVPKGDGKGYADEPAKILAYSQTADLALLHVPGTERLPCLPLTTGALPMGAPVEIVGFPGEFAVRRGRVIGGTEESPWWDPGVWPGDSGGALVTTNENGMTRLRGIVAQQVLKLLSGDRAGGKQLFGGESIGPRAIAEFLARARETSPELAPIEISHAALGVLFEKIDVGARHEIQARGCPLGREDPARIRLVNRLGPLSNKVKPGDVIIGIDAPDVPLPPGVRGGRVSFTEQVLLDVRRVLRPGEQQMRLEVCHPAEGRRAFSVDKLPTMTEYFDTWLRETIGLAVVPDGDGGVRVSRVGEGSRSEVVGLQIGDVIQHVGFMFVPGRRQRGATSLKVPTGLDLVMDDPTGEVERRPINDAAGLLEALTTRGASRLHIQRDSNTLALEVRPLKGPLFSVLEEASSAP